MSSPEKKSKATKKPSVKNNKKKTPALVLSPTTQSTSNPSLPDDLLISCFARVSRLQYPSLSFVSKTFTSLLASPELYKTRSSLSNTESCLYVCLDFNPDPNHPNPSHGWFTLCRRPDRTIRSTTNSEVKKRKKSSGYVLAKLPTHHSGPVHRFSLVTVGSHIYNIGGPIDVDGNEPSSRVLILDSRSNTWVEGPSMLVKRNYPKANVVDGKIYVAGGFKDKDSSSSWRDWMEVFDPKTQTWELVSCPDVETRGFDNITTSAGIDGTLYMYGSGGGMSYRPREGRWERLGWEMDTGWVWFSYSVIGDVLFFYNEGQFEWYDINARLWRYLKGVKGLPKFPRYITRLADYGGKMAVLWERVVAKKDKVVLCAVIALERRNDEEIWGKVEWHGTVLTVPKSCKVECAIATTF